VVLRENTDLVHDPGVIAPVVRPSLYATDLLRREVQDLTRPSRDGLLVGPVVQGTDRDLDVVKAIHRLIQRKKV